MKQKIKREVFVRINSRVTPAQKAWIKEFAKKNKVSEGELHRKIVEQFITKYS